MFGNTVSQKSSELLEISSYHILVGLVKMPFGTTGYSKTCLELNVRAWIRTEFLFNQ